MCGLNAGPGCVSSGPGAGWAAAVSHGPSAEKVTCSAETDLTLKTRALCLQPRVPQPHEKRVLNDDRACDAAPSSSKSATEGRNFQLRGEAPRPACVSRVKKKAHVKFTREHPAPANARPLSRQAPRPVAGLPAKPRPPACRRRSHGAGRPSTRGVHPGLGKEVASAEFSVANIDD